MPESESNFNQLSITERQTYAEISPDRYGKTELFKLPSPKPGEPDLITIDLLNNDSNSSLKIVAANKRVRIPQQIIKFKDSVFAAEPLFIDDEKTRHLLKTEQTAVFIPYASISSSERLLLQLLVDGQPFFIDVRVVVPSIHKPEPYVYHVEGNVQLFKERVLSIDQFLVEQNVDTSNLNQLELALLEWAYKRHKKEAVAAPYLDPNESQLTDISQDRISTSQELQLFFWAKAVYLSGVPSNLPTTEDESRLSSQSSPLKKFVQLQLRALFPADEIERIKKDLGKQKNIISTTRNAFAGIEQQVTTKPALSPQEAAAATAELAKLVKKIEQTFFFLQQAVDTRKRIYGFELQLDFLEPDEAMNQLLTHSNEFRDTFFADLLALFPLSPNKLVDSLFELYQSKTIPLAAKAPLSSLKNKLAKTSKTYFKMRFATEIAALLEMQIAFNEYQQTHQAKRKNNQPEFEERRTRLEDVSPKANDDPDTLPSFAELLGKSNDTK